MNKSDFPMPSAEYPLEPPVPFRPLATLGPDTSEETDQLSHHFRTTHGKRRYQFVLARVLFCMLAAQNAHGTLERVYFYRDGTVSCENVTNPHLLTWGQHKWSPDFNVAFWEIRRAVWGHPGAYTFSYDAGLMQLQAMLAG